MPSHPRSKADCECCTRLGCLVVVALVVAVAVLVAVVMVMVAGVVTVVRMLVLAVLSWWWRGRWRRR